MICWVCKITPTSSKESRNFSREKPKWVYLHDICSFSKSVFRKKWIWILCLWPQLFDGKFVQIGPSKLASSNSGRLFRLGVNSDSCRASEKKRSKVDGGYCR